MRSNNRDDNRVGMVAAHTLSFSFPFFFVFPLFLMLLSSWSAGHALFRPHTGLLCLWPLRSPSLLLLLLLLLPSFPSFSAFRSQYVSVIPSSPSADFLGFGASAFVPSLGFWSRVCIISLIVVAAHQWFGLSPTPLFLHNSRWFRILFLAVVLVLFLSSVIPPSVNFFGVWFWSPFFFFLVFCTQFLPLAESASVCCRFRSFWKQRSTRSCQCFCGIQCCCLRRGSGSGTGPWELLPARGAAELQSSTCGKKRI